MDKRVIFAVAGSGKTTYIIDSIKPDKRYLILTYTDGNYDNLKRKVIDKFSGVWPENIVLIKYFQFLYRFCYKPFLADKYKTRGMVFEPNPNFKISMNQESFYMTQSRYFYSNRLAFFLENVGEIDNIRNRIKSYFDVLVIDEVQDIAGRDFNFLEKLMETDVSMLFVGDFFQHTYDTSRDGNVNKTLFDNQEEYEKRFRERGVIPDHKTLVNSWRCSQDICEYITCNLGIKINSNRYDKSTISFIENYDIRDEILSDDSIVKLHYKNSSKFGMQHRNWGDTKGEDSYQDVCVLLNKATMDKYKDGKLSDLPPSTRNRLYVAITRAHGNVYLLEE